MLVIKEIILNIVLILSFLFGLFTIFYTLLKKDKAIWIKVLFIFEGIMFILVPIIYKIDIISKESLEIIYPLMVLLLVFANMYISKKEKIS